MRALPIPHLYPGEKFVEVQPAPLFEYEGSLYPDYLKRGNAMQFIATTALQFCKGRGVDVGAGKWPLPGAVPVDASSGPEEQYDAFNLPHNADAPDGKWEFVFSSHCLEHTFDPVGALEHWRDRLRDGGTLFLYLPSTQMRYWQTTRNRKHLHEWEPAQMARIVRDLGFINVIHGERDLMWSFAVVGWRP